MSKSKSTSKPAIEKKDQKNTMTIVFTLIFIIVIIMAFIFLGTPINKVGNKLIKIIPKTYNSGDSVLDYGWKTNTLHTDARWVKSNLGDTMHIRNDDWKTVDLRYYISITSSLSLDFIIHFNNSYFSTTDEIQLRLYSKGILVYQLEFDELLSMNPLYHLLQVRVIENEVTIYPRRFELDGSVNLTINPIIENMKLDWELDRSIPSGTLLKIDQFGFFVRHASMNLYISNITGSYNILDTI